MDATTMNTCPACKLELTTAADACPRCGERMDYEKVRERLAAERKDMEEWIAFMVNLLALALMFIGLPMLIWCTFNGVDRGMICGGFMAVIGAVLSLRK